MENERAQVMVPAAMSEKLAWLKELHRDAALSASAKNVGTALFWHHNEKTGQCNPSQKRLAEALSLSRKYVCKLVGELVSGGWVEATGTPGSSHYRLRLDRVAAGAEGPADELDGSDPRQGVSPTGGRGVSPVEGRGCPQLAAQNPPGTY